MADDRPLFEHISSTANDTVKLLRSLERKRERVETGLFLAEGARHAEEALANGWLPAYAFASQAALDRPQTRDLLLRMKSAGARVLTGTEKILATLSRKDNPQMVISAFRQRLTPLADFPTAGPRERSAVWPRCSAHSLDHGRRHEIRRARATPRIEVRCHCSRPTEIRSWSEK